MSKQEYKKMMCAETRSVEGDLDGFELKLGISEVIGFGGLAFEGWKLGSFLLDDSVDVLEIIHVELVRFPGCGH